MRVLMVAVALAAATIPSALPADSSASAGAIGGIMQLTKLNETAATVTLGWTPPVGVEWYLFFANGVRVANSTPLVDGSPRNSVRFSKSGGEPYEVVALTRSASGYAVDVGSYVAAPSPPPPPPPPPPPSGDDVVLVNQKWSPSGNWGAKDLVDVRILATDPRRDGVALAGSGTVRRFYGEQHSGDMFKIGPATDGPVTIGTYAQQSEFYSKAFSGAVHQDGIQAMGGKNVTFVGFYMQKDINGNSHFFCNMGSGGQERPTDIVVELSVINGYRGTAGHGGGRPVRISDSIRCGIRHVLVIYATDPGIPLMVAGNATDPVVVDSYSMTHANWDSIGGNALGPRHRDLWNADGSHKPLLDQLIANGKAVLLDD